MSIYFVLELGIFVMMESTNGVCYFCLLFILEMFVMMGNTSDVSCHFFYCILLLDKNYKQYLMRSIIFIYIKYSVHHLKKRVP